MNDLVTLKGSVPMVSTKSVADKFNKVHRDVMRAVENLDCSDGFRVRNFAQSYYMSAQGKKLKCMDMTRDGFSFLCMGFTGREAAVWKEAYINAFNRMEKSIQDGGSIMEAFAKAVHMMEQDREAASVCGKGLSEWKKLKRDHMRAVENLQEEAQMVLGFAKQ